MSDVRELADAIARVHETIAAACSRAARQPDDVTLVAVSKTVPAEHVRQAFEAGVLRFAENRVQDAIAKVAAVPGARWELIGPLQGNKARRAIELFERIETVDSLDLARRLDRIAGERRPGTRFPVLLQVNVDADPGKSGFEQASLERDLPAIADLPNLQLDGLMTIGRLVASAEAARPTFSALRALGERLRAREPRLGPGLSMGMTDDYPVAIEEGATIIRVGRAIFGERHDHRH